MRPAVEVLRTRRLPLDPCLLCTGAEPTGVRAALVELSTTWARHLHCNSAVDRVRGSSPTPSGGVSLSLGAVGLGLESFVLGSWYARSVHDDIRACKAAHARTINSGGHSYSDCGSCYQACDASGGIGPLIAYAGPMSFAPAIHRFVVGASTSGWVISAAIAGSIALGKLLDATTSGVNDVGAGGAIFGFIIPTPLGIVALATTPHREELVEKNGKPRALGFSLTPIVNRGGASGGIVGPAGAS